MSDKKVPWSKKKKKDNSQLLLTDILMTAREGASNAGVFLSEFVIFVWNNVSASDVKTKYESNADTNAYTDAEKTKLSGIETEATADQTGAEIKIAYEGEANTNAFTDADHIKLDGIENSATADQSGAEIKIAYEGEPDTNAFTDNEKSKLAGVETGATADQTDAEIKTAYENNANTNAFTDAEQSKLSGIESGATADQSDAEIKTAYENNADTNAFTDADHSKLDNIEANADVTDETNVTDALDGATLSTVAVEGTDGVLIQDGSDSDKLKVVTAQSIADLGGGGGLENIVEDITPQLGGVLDTNSKQIRESRGINVTSATELDLGDDGNSFEIIGTTDIESINTLGVGTRVILYFDDILTLVHSDDESLPISSDPISSDPISSDPISSDPISSDASSPNLVLPTSADIITEVGDVAIFWEYAIGDWRCISYTRASGEALIGVPFSSMPTLTTVTSTSNYVKPANLVGLKVWGTGAGGSGGGTVDAERGGSGGGSGATFIKYIPAEDLLASETMTIGAQGTNGSGTGGSGGTTSFGSHASATGGNGGSSNQTVGNLGGSGGTSTGGDVDIDGNYGGRGWRNNVENDGISGSGGVSYWGGMGAIPSMSSGTNYSGTTPRTWGAGGSGGAAGGSGANTNGAKGKEGVIIYEEIF